MNKEINIAEEIAALKLKLFKAEQRINKALEITYKILMNNVDNRLICENEFEEDYYNWLDREMLKQEQILKGSEE